MVLIRCETPYQLFNIINIKMTILKDVEADVVFSSASNLADFKESVEKLGLFRKVYLSEDNLTNSLAIAHLPNSEKKRLLSHIDKVLIPGEWQNIEYDEMYIPALTNMYTYAIFYNFYRQFKTTPSVIIYEDGTDTYSRNNKTIAIQQSAKCLYKSEVPESQRFENRMSRIMVYEPEVCYNKSKLPITAIPKVSPEVLAALESVFGTAKLPEEKFIFFSEPFHDEFINNNEADLLDHIAGIVGKDNIIVKLHPRCTFDQFSRKGYKIFPDSKIPWEIMCSDPAVSQKVLIAVSSTTLFSPKLVFNQKLNSIMLMKLMTKNRNFASQPDFIRLVKGVNSVFNRDERNVFSPNHIDELDMALDYYNMMPEDSN